jgi:hypothetical protein
MQGRDLTPLVGKFFHTFDDGGKLNLCLAAAVERLERRGGDQPRNLLSETPEEAAAVPGE